MPSVDAAGAYSRSRDSETTQNGQFFEQDSSGSDTYRIGLDASWEIDVFGGIARTVEAADADIQALEDGDLRVLLLLYLPN